MLYIDFFKVKYLSFVKIKTETLLSLNFYFLLLKNIKTFYFKMIFRMQRPKLFACSMCVFIIYMHIYIYIYTYISSSSCCTISTDISDLFSPPFSIVHCFWQVFRATSHISKELLYVGSSWLSRLCSSL